MELLRLLRILIRDGNKIFNFMPDQPDKLNVQNPNDEAAERLRIILDLLTKLTVDIDKLRGQFTKTALKAQVDEKVKRLVKTIML